jgi:secreted PhoX family phosphatase
MNRRTFFKGFVAGAAGLAFGPSFWRAAYAQEAIAGVGPYGPLRPPDANGVMLPEGFSSRILAVQGREVAGTGHRWHESPDGGATFGMEDGGWVYTSNSEETPGGTGALRFDPQGEIVAAYAILSETSHNCAGGPTPWGTWLSCEEQSEGQAWECQVDRPGQGVVRPALGRFSHESIAVDPVRGQLYLTEDAPDGRFYRFTPERYRDDGDGVLDAGLLEAAVVASDGATTWRPVDPEVVAERARDPRTTVFDGGEGTWYDSDVVYFTTKGDNRVRAFDCARQRMTVIYDDDMFGGPESAPLTGVDNVTVSPAGDIYVAEDGGDLAMVVLALDGDHRVVTPMLRLTGHGGSELTGPAFDPSGTRLYFSSQRGLEEREEGVGKGVTFEVAGPFRGTGEDRATRRGAEHVRISQELAGA